MTHLIGEVGLHFAAGPTMLLICESLSYDRTVLSRSSVLVWCGGQLEELPLDGQALGMQQFGLRIRVACTGSTRF